MRPSKFIRNVPASVHQRLLNVSRNQRLDFQILLDRYTCERFLYRLSVSDEVDRFVLKGAALFRIWAGKAERPTRDIDFLAKSFEDHASILAALETICDIPCREDGVVFNPATVRLAEIRRGQPHGGLRAQIQGKLGRIRLPLQVDIGFGDTVIPAPEEQYYPTLLDLPAPRLWTYPRETMIAEKLHAMVDHGDENTRVKDLWDVASLARRFGFKGEILWAAITETFGQCGTSLGRDRPVALLSAYYKDPTRERLWRKLRRDIPSEADGPDRLVDAGIELERFLGPVYDSLIAGSAFRLAWPAGGPWRSEVQAQMEGDDRA